MDRFLVFTRPHKAETRRLSPPPRTFRRNAPASGVAETYYSSFSPSMCPYSSLIDAVNILNVTF